MHVSGSMGILNDVERTVSLPGHRTKPPECSISSNDVRICASESGGDLSRASSRIDGFRDSYTGSLLGNTPDGWGDYIWSDGCEYDGEWRAGMRHGQGKLRWPSGALYEGEFFGGYMHGSGTYTRPDQTVYRGRWRLNLKHGLGYQTYPNGDVFEGSWINGAAEGPGKYTWANGNVYSGNMKAGKMSGKGTLTWVNGDSYEGNWLNGVMDGFGMYTWIDGGCYVGMWTRGLKDGKGTFYPKGNKIPPGQQLYLNALRKQGLLPDLKKQSQVTSKNPNLGKQSRSKNGSLERRWSLEASIEKFIRKESSSEIVLEGEDNEDGAIAPNLEREYMQGVLISELVLSDRFSAPSSRREKKRQEKFVRAIKRPGEQIIKGHRSYDLMLSLQLGIRYSVSSFTGIPEREVSKADFSRRASFWRSFPRKGSQQTPPHNSDDFKWKDYCPFVFRNLRAMFRIDVADYMLSICGSDALRELSSPGKSGSVFFLSQDDRFMIKTLRKSEAKVLRRMLQNYYSHVGSYENTLITKFFGLYRIIPSSGQKFRFVVMGNVFCTELRIHRRFDLKGSSLGRSAKVEIDENTILKDLDLNYCFYLEPSWRDSLLQQIEIDSKFLESENIMDYSLLLGIHYRAPQHFRSLMSHSHRMLMEGLDIVAEDEATEDEISPQGLVLVPRGSDDDSAIVGLHIRGSRLKASSSNGDEEVDLLLPGTARLQIQLGVNMPARAEHISGTDKGTKMFHEVYDVVLYLGIIDILQDYSMKKKIEHAYKSVQFDSVSISAVEPTFYSSRFLGFIKKVFPPNANATAG